MSNTSDPVRRRLLDAAMTLFLQYGFHRTGMADIARAAGVSRQSLYLRFSNKTALFTALGAAIKDDALAAAAAVERQGKIWRRISPRRKGLGDLPLYRLLHAPPHGAELLAVDAELTAACPRLDRGFAAILAGRSRRWR